MYAEYQTLNKLEYFLSVFSLLLTIQNYLNKYKKHTAVLQTLSSVLLPLQPASPGSPPTQDLDLCSNPAPQVAVQDPHSLHNPHAGQLCCITYWFNLFGVRDRHISRNNLISNFAKVNVFSRNLYNKQLISTTKQIEIEKKKHKQFHKMY